MSKKHILSIIVLAVLALTVLAACSSLAGAQAVQPTATLDPAVTPTDCGCSAEGPNQPKPTSALGGGPAGPAAPGDATLTPAGNTDVAGRWETYTNPEPAFTFEYPAAYATQKYGFCAARPNANPPAGTQFGLSLGSRTEISISPAPADLDAALAAFRADPSHKDYQFDAPADRTVGGVPARVLPYRSGGTNRYGESTFFIKDGLLYRIDTGTPSACDVPDLNLTEMQAYAHLLDSFQFK